MLKFSILDFSFGTIKHNQMNTYKISITSTYTLPVHITAPTTSCGCTTAYVENNPVAANSSTSLVVQFNSGKVALGQQSKKVTISWVDPINNKSFSQTFNFTANVIR